MCAQLTLVGVRADFNAVASVARFAAACERADGVVASCVRVAIVSQTCAFIDACACQPVPGVTRVTATHKRSIGVRATSVGITAMQGKDTFIVVCARRSVSRISTFARARKRPEDILTE